MESYGELLRKARETKGFSLERVSAETTISRSYIVGLEEEDCGAFPGEPYMIGFLRTYSDFLDLDTDVILKLFQAKKIQESPVPAELLAKKRPKFLLPLIIILIFLLLSSLGVYLYLFVFDVPEHQAEKARAALEQAAPHKYQASFTPQNLRVYVKDQILVGSETSSSKIVLTVCSTVNNSVGFEMPAGVQYVDLGEERDLDINGDGVAELIVWVADCSKNDESRGAEIRVTIKEGEGSTVYLEEVEETLRVDADITQTESIAIKTDEKKQVVILDDNRAYPFTLKITFRGPCLFRYQVDFRGDKVEGYYKSGDTVSITSQYSGVRLWMSNGNALQIQVIAGAAQKSLTGGTTGRVEVQDIKWVRSEGGRYSLVVEGVD